MATASVEAFRGSFGGEAIVPGDSSYDAARRVCNGDIDDHQLSIRSESDRG